MSKRTKREARERLRLALDDEPGRDGEDFVEYGGEVYLAMGFTSAGCPYGPTLGEVRESDLRYARDRGWARAHRAMCAAVRGLGLPEPDLGRVRKIGQGLSREAFATDVHTDGAGWPRVLVALVPRRGERAARGMRDRVVDDEARLLALLAQRDLGFRVPGLAVAVRDGEDVLLVCEFLEGLPVDLRAGRMASVRPWELVGNVAAAVHRIPVDELDWLVGYPTRRAHGEALVEDLSDLDGASDETVREGLAWIREHLPPAEPSTLVHGDLLGQNLRLLPGAPLGVLDWERALRGDPAHDLAIVTRGVRKPFQVVDGMERLLEVYNAAAMGDGRPPLTELDVRFHEITLHLRWYRDDRAGVPSAGLGGVLARLRNLVNFVRPWGEGYGTAFPLRSSSAPLLARRARDLGNPGCPSD